MALTTHKYLEIGGRIASDIDEEANSAVADMQEFFRELKAQPRETQLAFFHELQGMILADSLRETLDLAFDYPPRCDSSTFESFEDLVD